MLKAILISSLLLISTASIAGDLEGNTTTIDVIGDTTISNNYTGSGSYGGIDVNVGGRATANSLVVDCATLTSCGNNNNTSIDVKGNTTISGNGVANSVILNSD